MKKAGEKEKKGVLYICATPIGNLQDASFRLVDVLNNADLIIAEDTRTTKKLLSKYEIRGYKIESYHDNTAEKKTQDIIQKLKSGLDVALVSESGVPLISDPGFKLIKRCIEENIDLSPIPGPNAALSALVISGLPVDNFLFVGFLPKTDIKIKNKLEEIKNLPYTIIFYESPNRTGNLLGLMRKVLGDRDMCLAREITKVFEECLRGKISEVLQTIEEREKKGLKLKGEIVLVVSGQETRKIKNFNEDAIKKELDILLKRGIVKKEAFKDIMKRYEISRRKLYDISIKLNRF
ncbi:MAG: 16S rRNA (cytidine(1402)-2'-O)-methyltransferase [Actinomycetota bacterium]|nr:16S rRNA (cytidine(1402)-2'-O)-methyltransferase [Actinomycetota bacterium]